MENNQILIYLLQNVSYTILSLFVINLFYQKIIFLNNRLDFTIKRQFFEIHLQGLVLPILKIIGFFSKEKSIELFFNGKKEKYNHSTISIKNEKIINYNSIMYLSISLDPKFDISISSKISTGGYTTGPINISYFIKIFSKEKFIKVYIPHKELAKISQKNISNYYLIPFSEVNERSTNNITITDILYQFIKDREIGKLNLSINKIIEDYIQPIY